MLCEKCKKQQATVFYEETINGSTRSYSLCADCASAMEKSGEIALQKGFGGSLFAAPFGSITDNLFSSLFSLPENARTSRKLCPLCHASLEAFRRSGKAGCPLCYETFADELRASIRSIHGSVGHIGRSPRESKQQKETQNEKQNVSDTRLEALKAELKGAIAEENFEKAAELRDSIRAIESEG